MTSHGIKPFPITVWDANGLARRIIGPLPPEILVNVVPEDEDGRYAKWSPDEDQFLLLFWRRGVAMKKIAIKLPGRSIHACSTRVRILLKRERDEKAA